MDFLCILQTHSLTNAQPNLKRYGCNNKSEITKRCTRSLVKSMNDAAKRAPGITFRLHVFDDHSDEQSITAIKNALSTAKFETKFFELATRGEMPGILKCYEHGKEAGKDMVYFAHDDYLFTESAIYEMAEMFVNGSQNFARWCAIYPFDDPYRYYPNNITPVEIIHGASRHWRRNYQTASCFMTHHAVITENWDLFDAMGRHPIDPKMEDNTINRLFQERGYMLLTPIPSLALHFQFDTEKDPYIDWRSWWDKHSDRLD